MINADVFLLGCTIFWVFALTACVVFLIKSDGGNFLGKDEQD